jgi:hypothetical protein
MISVFNRCNQTWNMNDYTQEKEKSGETNPENIRIWNWR